jgi:hypothetical protein
VGQNPVSGPDSGAFGAIQAGSVPAISSFEAADPAFAPGSPFHGLAERGPVFGGVAGLARSAFARDDDGAYPEVAQRVVNAFLAVAAVGGDGARLATGALDDPLDGTVNLLKLSGGTGMVGSGGSVPKIRFRLLWPCR